MEPVLGDLRAESPLSACGARGPEPGLQDPLSPRTHRGIYLARHGETESNRLRRYAGYSPELLTETGRSEMVGLAARLGVCGLAEIWTSEVARARESASVVSHVLNVPVRLDERLNEMRMGLWEGLTETEVADRYPEAYALWCTLPDRLTLDGRETLGEVADRVTAAVRDAASQPRPVLLITHVAPFRMAVLTALGLPLRLYKRVRVENGDCAHIYCDQHKVHRLGEDRSMKHRLDLSLAGPETSVA